MGSIAFDQDKASRLINALEEASDRLDNQGTERATAANTAMEDFAGGYARAFRDGISEETQDRAHLRHEFYFLAQQIRRAQRDAEAEERRLEDAAQWEQSMSTWAADSKSGSAFSTQADFVGLMLTRPSQTPVTPPTVSAEFEARERPRTADGGAGAVSSAKPGQLRSYVSVAQTCMGIVDEELSSLQSAWSAFRGTCSWVNVGTFTLLDGLAAYAEQGALDARWISQIADAFEAAGTAELPNAQLNLLAPSLDTPKLTDQQLLDVLATFDQSHLTRLMDNSPALANQLQLIDPATINNWWRQMLTQDLGKQQTTLWETLPEIFGNLEGIPYNVRHKANEAVLEKRLHALETNVAELESRLYDPIRNGATSRREVRTTLDPDDLSELAELQTQLEAYTEIDTALESNFGQPDKQLISLSNDQPPLSAIAIGNLDTASNVTYSVAGMNSTTTRMTNWTDATENVHQSASDNSGDTATVAWLGYEAPESPPRDWGVFDNEMAETGGDNLASTLEGFEAVRGDDNPQINVLAHSYGTTTVAFALSQSGIDVDQIIFAGSAGLPDHIASASDLNAENVYAGHARDAIPYAEDGDEWAWLGRELSSEHGVDPMSEDFGAVTFGTDTRADGAGEPVTTHSVHEPEDGAGYYDPETEASINIGRILRNEQEQISEHVNQGLTPLQQSLIHNPTVLPYSYR